MVRHRRDHAMWRLSAGGALSAAGGAQADPGDVKKGAAANSRGDARGDQCRVTLDLSAFNALSDATSPATSMKCASSFMRRSRAILLKRTSSLRIWFWSMLLMRASPHLAAISE